MTRATVCNCSRQRTTRRELRVQRRSAPEQTGQRVGVIVGEPSLYRRVRCERRPVLWQLPAAGTRRPQRCRYPRRAASDNSRGSVWSHHIEPPWHSGSVCLKIACPPSFRLSRTSARIRLGSWVDPGWFDPSGQSSRDRPHADIISKFFQFRLSKPLLSTTQPPYQRFRAGLKRMVVQRFTSSQKPPDTASSESAPSSRSAGIRWLPLR
jgi:hypothetical protein